MTRTDTITEREEAHHALQSRIDRERRFGESRDPDYYAADHARTQRYIARRRAVINVRLVRERYEIWAQQKESDG